MQDFTILPSVTVTRETSVGAEALWSVLSDLPALARWAPGIDAAEVTSAETGGIGALRAVTTAQFGVIHHDVTEWEPAKAFAYITADSGPFARTFTRYEMSDDLVSVSLYFEVKPGAMDVAQAQAVLNKGLTATLQALDLHARMAQVQS